MITIKLEGQNFRATKIPPCELHQVHTEELDRTAPSLTPSLQFARH